MTNLLQSTLTYRNLKIPIVKLHCHILKQALREIAVNILKINAKPKLRNFAEIVIVSKILLKLKKKKKPNKQTKKNP